jgi:hypothetical protein
VYFRDKLSVSLCVFVPASVKSLHDGSYLGVFCKTRRCTSLIREKKKPTDLSEERDYYLEEDTRFWKLEH